VLKYSSRALINLSEKPKKETVKLMETMLKSIPAYYDLFYTFDFKKASSLYKNRDDCLKEILNISKKVPARELLILEKTASILELITDISDSRMALEYN
jgi:hypothetical protein